MEFLLIISVTMNALLCTNADTYFSESRTGTYAHKRKELSVGDFKNRRFSQYTEYLRF